MYTQARYFIRTALVQLLAAFIVGAALHDPLVALAGRDSPVLRAMLLFAG